MNSNDRLREQIDACRPGSDDLGLPALSELADAARRDPAVAAELARSQQLDAQLRSAIRDVPVPAGLAERLLQAAQHPDEPEANVCLPANPERRQWFVRRPNLTRRHWILAGCSTALVGLIAFVSSQLLEPLRTVTQEEIASETLVARAHLSATAWQPIAKLPRNIRIDPAVIGTPHHWQIVRAANSAAWSAGITAIDLTPQGAGRAKAFLFVVSSSAKFSVPTRPAAVARLSLSGGYTATAWQRLGSNLLFVLVVEEDRNQHLEDYLRSGPAA